MDHRILAQKIAEESFVLLRNADETLPLKPGTGVAFFGRGYLQPFLSGNGSGGAYTQDACTLLDACEKAGLQAFQPLHTHYTEELKKETPPTGLDWDNVAEMAKLVHSGVIYEYFGQYHAPLPEIQIPDGLLQQSAQSTDTAIFVLSRNAGGEECDRHIHNDYELSEEEKRLISRICDSFVKVIVVLNINGLIDMSWLDEHPQIKSVLYIGLPGQEGAAALAAVLTGTVSPSGCLAFTIPYRYDDLPTSEHFSFDRSGKVLEYQDYGLDAAQNGSVGFSKSPVTVYQEDLFLGYRYFDAFDKEPMFPFGFGLSYTQFHVNCSDVYRENDAIAVNVTVRNCGNRAGREVVQLYVSAQGTRLDQPRQTLKGFSKTPLLQPGEETTLKLILPCTELASFEPQKKAWIILPGIYDLRVGTSSRSTTAAAAVLVDKEIPVQTCKAVLPLQSCNEEKIPFLTSAATGNVPLECRAKVIALEGWTPNERILLQEKQHDLGGFSLEELAALSVGYGSGVPFSAFEKNEFPKTLLLKDGRPFVCNDHPTGMNGYVSPAVPERGIHSASYKDGPAGIGTTAWPAEMLLACSFDTDLCREFGEAIGRECVEQGVDVWLAPAVNLHRNPLGGRNFEYFSEDPYLTGTCAVAVTQGVQKNRRVLVCPKHFALNEQETFRRGYARWNVDAVDSIVTERAARELYLKPFEMLVKQADIHCLMTSFNKVNGVFAAAHADLCTDILRGEWGFDGLIVTDWGDMDIVADGADAIRAGVDVVMPGGPPVIEQILEGVKEGRLERWEIERTVSRLLKLLERVGRKDG